MRLSIYVGVCAILLLSSCKQKNSSLQEGSGTYRVGYATGYTVDHRPGYTEINVRDPWDPTKYLQRYLLVERGRELPKTLPEGIVIRTPLNRVVVSNSIQCSMLDLLGIRKEIVGVCESRYIALNFIQTGLTDGKVTDIGEAAAPDVEKLIELEPDAIITSPLSNAPYGRVEKTGIPQIKCVDYMEPTPLGRAEWIRFLSLFFGKEAVADSLFGETEKAYHEVRELAKGARANPSALTDMKYGPIWYMPGGRSYMACFLRDAGADYAWKEDEHTGSIPLSFEGVFERSGNADFWLIKYNRVQDWTYADLEKEYAPYANFAAWKKRNIFICNTGRLPYYEEVPIYPHYLLKDLVGIFHPELLPGYRLRYFKRMEE